MKINILMDKDLKAKAKAQEKRNRKNALRKKNWTGVTNVKKT